MNHKSPPTITDVARQARVSTATVSRVLNGNPRVIADTARRVEEAVALLGYTPLPAARVLAGRKTHTLGLVIPEIGGDFFVPLLRGIEGAARQAGYNLLVQAGDSRLELALGSHNTDGLLVYTGALDSPSLSRLSAAGLPYVQLYAQPDPESPAPSVTVDNLHGTALVMDHLVTVHARKRIVFLAGPAQEPDAISRLQGYRVALQRHGLAADPALVAQGGFSHELACQSVEDLIASGVGFDAIFAADDQSAAGALAALHRAKIAVPQSVSLVGFDDVAFASYLNPPLTTVHAPTEIVGQAAVQHLLKLIRGEAVERLTSLPTALCVRRSCGCLPQS
jgi:DNA-binding LacI/PurR family transcriptional regulator